MFNDSFQYTSDVLNAIKIVVIIAKPEIKGDLFYSLYV